VRAHVRFLLHPRRRPLCIFTCDHVLLPPHGSEALKGRREVTADIARWGGTWCGESLSGNGRTPSRTARLASLPAAGKGREALDLVGAEERSGKRRRREERGSQLPSRGARREPQPSLEAGLICGGFFISLFGIDGVFGDADLYFLLETV
jgi:hypothetical protein